MRRRQSPEAPCLRLLKGPLTPSSSSSGGAGELVRNGASGLTGGAGQGQPQRGTGAVSQVGGVSREKGSETVK